MSRSLTRLLLVLPLLLLAAASGCVTREVKERVFDRGGIDVFLREHKRGMSVVEREFQHPVQISAQRLVHILGAVDIRGREEQLAGIRAAFEPSQLSTIGEGLSKAFREASPNQEIAVSIVRKQQQHVIFDRKHLTSFVAWVQNDLLFLSFSRVDWRIPDRVKKTALPEPRVGDHPMKFKVVPSAGMYPEGAYAVSMEWQDPIFRRPIRRAAQAADRQRRTILMDEPDLPAARKTSIPAGALQLLTPAQLRELADLEEARQEGRLSEGHYRRAREKILQAARENSATSR